MRAQPSLGAGPRPLTGATQQYHALWAWLFIRRTKAIKDKAAELGITDPKEMDGLGALTREKKAKDLTRSQLHDIWWQRLAPAEKAFLDALKMRQTRSQEMGLSAEAGFTPLKTLLGQSNTAILALESSPFVVQPKNDREAVAFAVEHIFERQSVVSERELITEALQWGYGLATVDGVKQAVKEMPLIRVEKGGQTLLTTAEVLAEEKRIVRECQLGKNGYAPIFADWRIQDKQLNPQQREAVLSVLNSRDFITGISGKGRAKLLCCMRPNAALMRRGKSCLSLLQHQRPRG